MNNSNLQNSQLSDVIENAMKSEVISQINPFPIDAFPLLFKDFILDLQKSLNYSHDYTGTAILTAIATAIAIATITLTTISAEEDKRLWNHLS